MMSTYNVNKTSSGTKLILNKCPIFAVIARGKSAEEYEDDD